MIENETTRVRRRVVVACTDSDGASALWPAIFSWVPDLVEEDYQWDYVRKICADEGYEGPFIIFDETEWAFRRCFDLAFQWDSSDIPTYQVPATKARKFKLTAIEWDLDDGSDSGQGRISELEDLESELNAKWLNTAWLVPAPGSEPENYIADQLSDRSGWCTLGLTLEEVFGE